MPRKNAAQVSAAANSRITIFQDQHFLEAAMIYGLAANQLIQTYDVAASLVMAAHLDSIN
jgi:hypothetical protein